MEKSKLNLELTNVKNKIKTEIKVTVIPKTHKKLI